MNLYELVGGTEKNPTYQDLATSNLERQYSFLASLISAAIAVEHFEVSGETISMLNHHAIAGLHSRPGEYRNTPVGIVGGKNGEVVYAPPPISDVRPLMDEFVKQVNRDWDKDPIVLAAYCLWRLNFIHPFVNGNGRTARALCYYVLCVKHGYLLPGDPAIPELLRANRPEYIDALREADRANEERRVAQGLTTLTDLLSRLLTQQLT